MKQFTLFIVTILFLFGCLQTNSPKSTVVKFISEVKKLDFENSGALVTDETKNVFGEAKLKLQNSPACEEELSKSKALNESDIIKTYGLDQLIERVSDKNAIVLTKDSTNKINLEKVGGLWKIVCTDYIINGILFENSNKENVMTAYGTLQEESKRRTDLINNIIGSTSNADATAIKQKLRK